MSLGNDLFVDDLNFPYKSVNKLLRCELSQTLIGELFNEIFKKKPQPEVAFKTENWSNF